MGCNRVPGVTSIIKRIATCLAAGWLLAALAAPVQAAGTGSETGPETGLPLPRFVSLAAEPANVRTGPGVRYPIEWVFKRKGLPVEIIAEYELWRKIRDSDDAVGWVHKRLLSGRRTVLVGGDSMQVLLEQPETGAKTVTLAEPGVVARLLECRGLWCRIDAAGREGWIPRASLWGVAPD